MKKSVFKLFQDTPRSLVDYERAVLADPNDREGADEDPAELRARVLEEARQEAEEKVQEAYAEGLRRGTEAGREAFLKVAEGAAAALGLASETIREAHAEFLDTMEPQVLALVRLVVERVVRREMREDPELVLRTVRAALDRVAHLGEVVIRLHPDDLETIRAHEIEILEQFAGVDEVHLQGDESVGRGGCMVETPEVEIDARLETQLRELLDALLDVHEQDDEE